MCIRDRIYTLFNNRLIEPQNNSEDMNLEDVKKRPRFKDCASDADVFRLMDHLAEEAGKVPILTKENTDCLLYTSEQGNLLFTTHLCHQRFEHLLEERVLQLVVLHVATVSYTHLADRR